MLSIKCKTIKCLEENIGGILCDPVFDDVFRYHSKSMIHERKINFGHYLDKIFCQQKILLTEYKDSP